MENVKYIVCVDSDGCAMDTMDYKHINYFGPIAVEEWNIENKEDFLKIWNNVNLFSQTRGCNRFIGLNKTFEIFRESNNNEGIVLNDLKKWIEKTKELSNNSLIEEIKKTNSNELKKVLEWSKKVNELIKNQKHDSKPFELVFETIEFISKNAEIAIVSSANNEALEKEWNENKLMQFVTYVFGQEEGSKKECIANLISKGYRKEQMIMIGDSPGDYKAAFDNGIKFYPILFGLEKESWQKFQKIYFEKFISNKFDSKDQQKLLDDFNNNINKWKSY